MDERVVYEALHGIPCIAMVANNLRCASSHGVLPTNWEFHLLLYEEVNHKKWRPVQVPLVLGLCGHLY